MIFPRLLPLFSMGTIMFYGLKTCAASSKAIVYGVMSQVKSKLLFVLRMKKTRNLLIVLKIGIARITKSSLGFTTLLVPFWYVVYLGSDGAVYPYRRGSSRFSNLSYQIRSVSSYPVPDGLDI